MAKPVLPKNLTPTMPAGKAAGAFLVAKRKEVARYAQDALSGEVEGVHNMRVAIKRLREGLRLFRRLFPRRLRVRTMGMVEELNDTLGRARDLDVLSGNLIWLMEQAPAAAAKLEELRASWTSDRCRAQEELSALWKRLEQGKRLTAQVTDLAEATAQRDRALNRLPLESFAYLSVRARANQVAQRLEALREHDDPLTLHRLRIAVKHLKYTMEPFLQPLPALQKPYAVVTEVQEELGLTHDFDVLESAVIDFFRQAGSTRTRAAQAALKTLRARRTELYTTAHAHLEDLVLVEWRQSLLDALD